MAKILVTGQHRGSTNALLSPARELQSRGHDLTIYATGDDVEVTGFQDLPYERASPMDHGKLLNGHDLLLTGLSGQATHDGAFIRVANSLGMTSIGVNEINQSWPDRLGCLDGDTLEGLPSIIAVTDDTAKGSMRASLPTKAGEAAIRRTEVVGWTAYDHFPQLIEDFTPDKRFATLESISHDSSKPLYFHATQNVHLPHDESFLKYEQALTHAVFDAAQRIGLQLLVKPHPREANSPDPDFTQREAEAYDHRYVSANAVETMPLIQSADAVTTGKSTVLLDACLLDRNTGALFPDVPNKVTRESWPPVYLEAIPVARTWGEIPQLFYNLTNPDNQVSLAENRKRFSTDGGASERVADLVEANL